MTEKKSKLILSSTPIISLIAIVISLASFLRAPKEHSDTLTSNVIASAYGDLGTLYPLQAHLLCLAEDYNRIRVQVKEATSKKISDEAARAELLLEERAVAQKIFTNYEYYYVLWNQATKVRDKPRAGFLKSVLDYFTGRVLTNPRLLWYWSSSGGGLEKYCDVDAIQYYKLNVKAGAAMDSSGPFAPISTAAQ